MNFTDQRRYERQSNIYGAARDNIFRADPTETDLRGRPLTVAVRVVSIGDPDTLLRDTRNFLVRHMTNLAVDAGADPRVIGRYGAWVKI